MGKLFETKGGKWGISYYEPNGRQIRKVISPYKKHAELALKKVEVEMAEGKYLERVPRLLFKDFAEVYFKSHIQIQTKVVYQQKNLLGGLVKYFGEMYLDDITPLVIRQFMAKRLKKDQVKPSTVNKDFTLLKSLFNRAIEWQVFRGSNPTMSIRKLPENNERSRWLTEDEISTLLAHCEGLTRVIVLIALSTGMRYGEIINLKWRQAKESNYVDFESATINIHESLSKSGKSRFIPVGDSVMDALSGVPRQKGTDYIFLNPDTGKPIGSIKRSFHTALRRAGITDFRFHDLRHTFASHLTKNGEHPKAIQVLLGHSSMKMTDRYSHLRPDQLNDVMERMEARMKAIQQIPSGNKQFLSSSPAEGSILKNSLSVTQIKQVS